MPTPRDAWRFSPQLSSLVVRYDAVLYPFQVPELLRVLPESGWIVPKAVLRRDQIAAEDLPTKGDAYVVLNQENKTLGVQGLELGEVITGYEELMDLVGAMFALPPSVTPQYLELRHRGWAQGQAEPATVMTEWWQELSQVMDLGAFVGEAMGADPSQLLPWGFNLAPAGVDANRPDWTQVQILPEAIRDNRFRFDIIHRRSVPDEVLTVARRMPEVLLDILERIGA